MFSLSDCLFLTEATIFQGGLSFSVLVFFARLYIEVDYVSRATMHRVIKVLYQMKLVQIRLSFSKQWLQLLLGLVGLLGDSVATLVNVPATNLEISQTHLFQKKNTSMYWESGLHEIICTYVIILRNSRYNIRLCVHKIDYFAILLSKIAFTM